MFSDALFSNTANKSSSDAESYNEDDMYGIDPSMIVMTNSSDDGEYVNTSKSSDVREEEDISEDREDGESLEGNENVSTYKSPRCIWD